MTSADYLADFDGYPSLCDRRGMEVDPDEGPIPALPEHGVRLLSIEQAMLLLGVAVVVVGGLLVFLAWYLLVGASGI